MRKFDVLVVIEKCCVFIFFIYKGEGLVILLIKWGC